jgi:hypothetical protein
MRHSWGRHRQRIAVGHGRRFVSPAEAQFDAYMGTASSECAFALRRFRLFVGQAQAARLGSALMKFGARSLGKRRFMRKVGAQR